MKAIRQTLCALLGLSALLATTPARAVNLFEMEVYPYQTASEDEKELENFSSFAGTDLRSTFEFNYGLSDRTEIGAYLDFARMTDQPFSHAGTRIRARTRLSEKDELPVDIGFYGEVAFPRNDSALVEADFKTILEKDIGRFTLSLNPGVERPLVTDGTEEPHFEFNYGAMLAYRAGRVVSPHLDVFGDIAAEDGKQFVSPAVDFKLGKGLLIGARAAFGLTAASEKTIGGLRVEYEF